MYHHPNMRPQFVRFMKVAALAMGAGAAPVTLAAQSSLPSAPSSASRWRGVFHLGAEHGGDKVVQFQYEDGSTPSVIAGGGLLLLGGATYTMWASATHAVELQGQTGIKWRTIPAATNQNANWLRIPVEGLVFWRTPTNLRVGTGVTMHLNNALKASGDVLDGTLGFSPAAGLLLQAEYAKKNYAVGLRYTNLQYTIDQGGSGTLNASSFGAGFTFFFTGKKNVKP